jgi:hypothetical protein
MVCIRSGSSNGGRVCEREAPTPRRPASIVQTSHGFPLGLANVAVEQGVAEPERVAADLLGGPGDRREPAHLALDFRQLDPEP